MYLWSERRTTCTFIVTPTWVGDSGSSNTSLHDSDGSEQFSVLLSIVFRFFKGIIRHFFSVLIV